MNTCRFLLTLSLAVLPGPTGLPADLDPSLEASWPGFLRDPAGVVSISSNHAYLGAGSVLAVDIRDPQQPRISGSHPGLASVANLVVSGHRACALDRNAGLHVIDLENPEAAPIPIPGHGPNQPNPVGLAFAGDLLLAAVPSSGLHILDLRDLRQPSLLATLPMQNPSGVVVSRGVAYLMERLPGPEKDLGRLHVVDLSQPAIPRVIGTLDTIGVPAHVAVADGLAALSIPRVGLRLIDVSDPTKPRQVGDYSSGGIQGGAVALAGRMAWLVSSAGLEMLDLADPATPRRVRLLGIDGWPENLVASNGFLYWGNWSAGLEILDVRLPNEPKPGGVLQAGGDYRAVATSGHHVFLADAPSGLQVLDLSNPLQPSPVAHFVTPRALTGLATVGDDVLCGLEIDQDAEGRERGGLAVIDITDPGHPRRRGGLNLAGAPTGLASSDQRVYAAHWHWDERLVQERACLEIVDLSDPDRPRSIGTYETTGRTAGVAVSGHHLFLTGLVEDPDLGYLGRIEVLDVRVPGQPRVLGAYRTRGEPSQVAVAGNYAYIAGRELESGTEGTETLLILDVADPTNPVRVGGHAGGSWGRQIALADGIAYLADFGWNGFVEVLDIRRPAAPVRQGGFELRGFPTGLAFAGPYLLLASGNFSSPWFGSRGEGLLIIDAHRPATLRAAGSLKLEWGAEHVSAAGQHAFASLTTNLVAVFDVRHPTHPKQVGSFTTEFRPTFVTLSEDRAYLVQAPLNGGADAGRLSVLDIGEPTQPRVLGNYDGRRLHGFAVSGHHGFGFWDGYTVSNGVSFPWSRLSVFDLIDSAHPHLVGEYRTNQSCSALAAAGALVFLSRPEIGLEVIDVGDPARPKRAGLYETEGQIRAVLTAGRIAYLAVDEYGTWTGIYGGRLEVLDLADPLHPRKCGSVHFFGRVLNLSVLGRYAYVVAERSGVHVIDISDPFNPRRVGGNSALQVRGLDIGHESVITIGRQGLVQLDPFATIRLGQPDLTVAGQVSFLCAGMKGQTLRIQRGRNLIDWEDWRSLTLDAETVKVFDDSPSGSNGFYRIHRSP